MAISSPGIGSNLDVNGIVSKLMAVEAQPLTVLQKKEASFQAKLSAYGTLNGALASFQNSVSALNSVSKFQAMSATAADTTILSSSATSAALPGNYSVTVTTLAQAQTISSAAQSSTTAAIGAGTSTTLTFQFGTISGGSLASGIYSSSTFTQDATQATGTVTIDSNNNSLQGIRDAINAAKVGVTASIVSDGSTTNPYHLLLTSNSTGLSKSMKITSSAGDASITSLLAYDPAGTQNLSQTAVAQNAALAVNGLSITSASNAVTGAISGATLNLTKGGTTTVTVANDTAAVVSAVQALVTSYNTTNKSLNSLTRVDPSTKVPGLLVGDASTQLIQARMRGTLATALSGLGSNTLTNISQIGVTFLKDGTLSLDTSKLQAALAANPGEFAQLFTAYGKPTDSLVSYVSASGNAKPGSYAVSVTNLATQGKVVGSAAVTTPLTITTGVNDQLALTVNGTSATVTLAAGTYATATTLAAQVQSAINGNTTFSSAGITLNATQSGGVLTLTSDRYGSASAVRVTGGTAITGLFGAAPTATVGTDVAGTINGVASQGKTVGSNKATQAIQTGSAALASTDISAANGNNALSLTVDGTAVNITISDNAAYTAATLATELQTQFDASALGPGRVVVSQSGGVFSFKSTTFGTTSSIGTVSGNGATNLLGATPTNSTESTISAGVNDQLTLSVDGTSTTVTLAAGTYTASTLATQIQTAVNADATIIAAGKSVSVTQSGDVLTLASSRFGAGSSLTITGGSGLTNLFGSAPTATAGALTGVAATGSGQFLTAATGLQGTSIGTDKGTQAQRVGSSAAGLTITGGSNDTLTVSIDGAAGVTATLTANTYTAATLATEVQTQINAALTLAGQTGQVTVTESGGILSITSNKFGTASNVSAVTGNSASNLLGATQTNSTVSTITAGVNDQLTLTVDGVSGTVTLAAGTYTAATLATQIQSAVNATPAFATANKAISVAQTAGVFTLTSNSTGATSAVQVTGGNARTNLLGASQTETAGNASSNDAGDIKLQIVGGITGSRGSVNFSQGYAYHLNTLLNSMLSSSGPLASSADGINKNIADLHKRADTLTVQLTATEKRYRAQFTALDLLVGNLSTTSSFLTQQLANLPKIS